MGPELTSPVLILAASLKKVYAQERLEVKDIYAPFEEIRFEHTKSKFFNLKNSMGAGKYFKKNKKQILDFIAVLIAVAFFKGKTTLLVAKKNTKTLVIEFLRGCIHSLHNRLSSSLEWAIVTKASSEAVVIS
jgi:hypothetical protein